MKYRHILILFLIVGAIMASVCLLRHCDSGVSGNFVMSQTDSAELARFEQEVVVDSLTQVLEREAHYEAQKQKWAAEREARYQHRRDSFAAIRSQRAREYLADQRMWDSIRANNPQKLAEGMTIELNFSDTTALMQVPLIGSGRAMQIIGYRERLGGYVSIDQLKEINHMPPEITRWFTVDTSAPIRKLRINHEDFNSLLAHPYLSYEQVKIIMNYRRKMGSIRSWEALSLSPEFSESDFKRLTPYISFE